MQGHPGTATWREVVTIKDFGFEGSRKADAVDRVKGSFM